MPFSPFEHMQLAVDIVNTSLHPQNKIAATLYGTDDEGLTFNISYTNYWPPPILSSLGRDQRIGNSSGTVHAETACILHAPFTYNNNLCVTDPFCPNCAKNIAEAGVKAIYIDHKGFNKDFVSRRSKDFETISMQICEAAGINVYVLNRKTETIEDIYIAPPNFIPLAERPVDIIPLKENSVESFLKLITDARSLYPSSRVSIGVAQDHNCNIFGITARSISMIGQRAQSPILDSDKQTEKYSLILEPVNRLITCAPKHGLKLFCSFIYYSQVPTSRELVNLIGAGVNHIYIGNINLCRDEHGLKALQQLTQSGIVRVTVTP